MSSGRGVHHSHEDYLALLDSSPVKLEYRDGEIYALAACTPTHADLGAAMISLLIGALGERCRVSSCNFKVRIEATDLTTFPDATVVCGERVVSDVDRDAVVNPTIVVEVTSKSTEDHDRGDKLSHYKQLPSLEAVLIVSHRRQQVTLVERSDRGWVERNVRAGERVSLEAPALSFGVDDLYRGIALSD